MKYPKAATLFICIWANTAHAEPVVVRAGEHEDFTRLVLNIPEGTTWEIDEKPGNPTLTIDGLASGYDVSQTFNVIPRSRLLNVSVDGSRLNLQLGCDCPLNAFFERPSYLVIDISDGPPLVAVPERAEPIAPQFTAEVPRSQFSQFELLWRSQQNLEPEPNLEAQQADPSNLETPVTEAAEREVYLQTQRGLLEAFGEAVSRGIVDTVDPNVVVANRRETEETPPIDVFDSSSQPDTPPDASNLPQMHIRVTSSQDIPVDDAADAVSGLNGSGGTCIDPETVAVGSWVKNNNFNKNLSLSNSGLYNEAGNLEPAAALNRVKMYLYFGFGLEALKTGRTLASFDATYPELVDIAQILEYGFARHPKSLHRFADCQSDLALWGILAAKALPDAVSVNAPAALLALEKLPGHLRTFLGEQLAQRLFDRGDTENASAALRSSQRTGHSDKPTLTNAKITARASESKKSTAAIEQVVRSNSVDAPEAVIELVNSYLSRGVSVPADVALLAETYQFEYEGTEIGLKLLETHVMASASSAQIDKSFEALVKLGRQDQSNLFDGAASHLLSELTRLENPIEFLQNTLERRTELGQNLSSQAVINAANRLIDLGFAEVAGELATQSTSLSSEESQLLEAKILLSQGEPARVLEPLSHLSGEEAQLIRARAMQQLGNYDEASSSFLRAQRPDLARNSAWLATGWMENIEPDDVTFGNISRVATETVAEIPNNDDMLRNTRSAVDSAQNARETINALLQDVALEE